MRRLTTESVEFRRIMNNLRMENMDIPKEKQHRLLDSINQSEKITPALIRQWHDS
ncbi:hypothetical protein [Alkalicoccus urumqiensis]|uniref:hypothetical protein n=1 Tax=Alkalicoccus urumqiensis TaxID=1548213 RepID=UPI0015E5FB49|nr:hypothetical protein [Alkalicoccus urumqiensis]